MLENIFHNDIFGVYFLFLVSLDTLHGDYIRIQHANV